jgi:hypothetical protein
MAGMSMGLFPMSNIECRIKKAESAISSIGYDDQAYIDAWMSFFRGDGGKAFEPLPEFKGSKSKFAAIIINALSRYKNETGHGVPDEIWESKRDNRQGGAQV